jgi:hypothetical protein
MANNVRFHLSYEDQRMFIDEIRSLLRQGGIFINKEEKQKNWPNGGIEVYQKRGEALVLLGKITRPGRGVLKGSGIFSDIFTDSNKLLDRLLDHVDSTPGFRGFKEINRIGFRLRAVFLGIKTEKEIINDALDIFRQELSINISNMSTKDPAQSIKDLGGIDLTPARMNLETKTDSRLPLQGGGWRGKDKGVVGIKLRIDPALLKQLQNTSGFSPVIVRMQSTTDIQGFLGIDNSL